MPEPTATTPPPTGPHRHPQTGQPRRPRAQRDATHLWLDGPTRSEAAAGRLQGTAIGLRITTTREQLLNHRRRWQCFVEQVDALLADLDERGADDFTDLPVLDYVDIGRPYPAGGSTPAAAGGAA